MENCIFCKIIKGEIPCYKIYENEYVLAFLDIAKDLDGHTLVIPKIHCENIFDCPVEYLNETIKAVQKISQHYKNDCGFDGVNILNASGNSAEQSVFHLHFHILPRKNTDNFKVFPNVNSCNSTFEEMCKKLQIN